MGNTQNQTLTEAARNNRTAMICHTIEILFISLAYMLEFVKGFRTLGYVLMTMVIGMVSPVMEWLIYKKDKENRMIMHLVGVGFAVFYIFIMMTTTSTLAFTYAVPMLVAVSVYNEMSFKLPVNLGVIATNIVQAGMFLAKGVYTLDNLANLEIQVIVMIVITLYSIYTSKTLAKNNEVKLQEISSQGQKTERLLNKTMDVSARISEEISKINEKTEDLSEAIQTTSGAMNEVMSGSTDTAEAVQAQLMMTQNIQNRVEDVSDGSEQISCAVVEVKHSVENGKIQISGLLQQVQNSVEAGKRVTMDLEHLQTVMSQMNSVVDIITEITSQTSLLSLNASIEAARAGEAGKGFAVVATEISKLADQTQQATEQITEMIGNVSGAIDDVAKVTGHMVEDISGQMTSTNKTAESFYEIENNTEAIVNNSSRLTQLVQQLADANSKIMDSVSTISAISQQVSAHATDTAGISEKNSKTVGEVLEISKRLQELAEQLNQ